MAGACGQLEASQSYPLAVLGGLGRLHEGWLLFFRFGDAEESHVGGLKKESRVHIGGAEHRVS